MSITIRQLEVFKAIYDSGSFAAAAERLDISQASISKQIMALESQLGITLFQRNRGRKAELTEEAQHLPAKVSQLLELASELKPHHEKSHKVRVACGDIIAAIINQSLPALLQQHPEIELEVVIMEPSLDSVSQAWEQGVDLASFSLKQPPPLANADCVSKIKTGIFVKQGGKLDRDWSEQATDQSLPVIFPLQGTSLAQSFEDTLNTTADINRYHVACRVQTDRARVEMALREVGAILSPYDKLREELAAGLLIPLALPPSFIYRYIFINPAIRTSPEISWVSDYVKEILGEDQAG